jgi:4-aminobutyrate aminotransferase/(S)-3-amino-2-methylpropionate transaminase
MDKTESLRLRKAAAVSTGVASRDIYAARAENAELWDVDGRRYIDFASGIAVTNTGHRHPRVMRAVAEQAEAFTHTCFHVSPYESYIRLAERLNEFVPIVGNAKTMFVTTGAEAVENAVKIARNATGRSGIIAFSGAFHGRTMMGMALTGKVMPYKKGFGPFPAEVYHATYPNTFMGISVAEALESIDTLLTVNVDPTRIAAIIVEPIQGEGGFVPAPPEFLVALRALADRHDMLLIVDEVQSGMARTGRMFGINHSGVRADIITLAKGLAGGFPLSAVVGRSDLMDTVHPGGLGGTYGGNPLAIAAANAVLDVIEDEKLCARAAMIGDRLSAKLSDIARRQGNEAIGDVRGLGAMVAFELVRGGEPNEANPALATAIVEETQARGLITLLCGTRFNVVRLLPPLTTPDEILVEALEILEASIDSVLSREVAGAE